MRCFLCGKALDGCVDSEPIRSGEMVAHKACVAKKQGSLYRDVPVDALIAGRDALLKRSCDSRVSVGDAVKMISHAKKIDEWMGGIEDEND